MYRKHQAEPKSSNDRAFPWFGALSKEGKASVVDAPYSLDCHKSEVLDQHPRSASGYIGVDTHSNTMLSSFCPPPAPTPTVDAKHASATVAASAPLIPVPPIHLYTLASVCTWSQFVRIQHVDRERGLGGGLSMQRRRGMKGNKV